MLNKKLPLKDRGSVSNADDRVKLEQKEETSLPKLAPIPAIRRYFSRQAVEAFE